MTVAKPMRVMTLGVHVVDVLVRPVGVIPATGAWGASPPRGLGSDHGTFDLAAADAFAAQTPARSAVPS